MTESIEYAPPKIIRNFIKHYSKQELFYSFIVGPYGSGKTTALFMKLMYMARQQEPGPDGLRHTRAVIVRNTMPQLKDTTIKSWGYWFKHGQAGEWKETEKTFILRSGDTVCEVMFRALDTEADVQRVLSLEVTFAIIDEFVEIPRKILEALAGRCGRYPTRKDGGATNWGIWGSSNPSTEDNWWYEYLHRLCKDENQNLPLAPMGQYFHQPSGLSEDAENLENLPGGRGYYTALAKGKTDAWVKQFIEAEWGFSIAGQPIITSIKPEIHFVSGLKINDLLPLVVGLDPGLEGSALIFGQLDLDGQLNVLGELVQSGYGAERLMSERLKPYIRARWPLYSLDDVIIAPDPAAANRASSDERSIVDRIKRFFKVSYESNNRMPLRIDAIDYFATKLTPLGPALKIDAKECPVLTRALRGGWRYKIDQKREVIASPIADKNQYSHPGDAFGYLCRFFHKQTERATRYGVTTTQIPGQGFRPPPVAPNRYHMR